MQRSDRSTRQVFSRVRNDWNLAGPGDDVEQHVRSVSDWQRNGGRLAHHSLWRRPIELVLSTDVRKARLLQSRGNPVPGIDLERGHGDPVWREPAADRTEAPGRLA